MDAMREAPTLTQDHDLITAARDGSVEALGELYQRHGAVVYGAALRLLGAPEDAEDVLQDVFVGLPRALRSYREQGRFAAWLKRLAVSTALMRLRSQRRKRETPLDDIEPASAAREQHPVDRLAVRRAIAALPDNLRLVFVLKEVEGYSHAEIAAMLDISAINSATRLSRAWTMLRREMT
jgi:RNA polymerase sigma-70 factor, ECF subfamily